jgi:hypothetical protein
VAWGFSVIPVSATPRILTRLLACILGISLIVAVHAQATDNPSEPGKQKKIFAAAVSTHSSNVDLAQLTCLSLDPNWAHVDRVDRSDDKDMRKEVAQFFRSSSFDSPDCDSFFSWTIIHEKTHAVRYRGRPSVTLMSFSVCKKPLDGPAGRRCLSKNVWLFDKISSPANEYSVGIKAFVSSPNVKWSVVNVSIGDE